MFFQSTIYITKNGSKLKITDYLNKIYPDIDNENIHYYESKTRSVGIEIIANLIKDVSIVHSNLNLFIIENGDSLTEQAQNSLLKVFEEPPENSRIIIFAENLDNLLETIRSRSLIIDINLEEEINESINNYIYKDFISYNFLKRKEVIESICKLDNSREVALGLISYIIRLRNIKENDELTSLLDLYRGLKRGVSVKLILLNLSILLN